MASNKLQTEKHRIVRLVDYYLKQKPKSTLALTQICKEILSILERDKSQETDKTKALADLEKHKIVRFLDNQLKLNPASSSELMQVRKGILSILEKEASQEADLHVGEAFYIFRNTVVHNLRAIAHFDQKFEQFNQFNILFEKYIIDILSGYQEPESSDMEKLPLSWLMYLEMKSFFCERNELT